MSAADSPRPNGRPHLPPEERQEVRVTVYMKRRERERLGVIARGVKKSLSRLLVEAALTGGITPPTPMQNLEQHRSLTRLGNLLNSAIKAAYLGKLKNLDVDRIRALERQVQMLAAAVRPRR